MGKKEKNIMYTNEQGTRLHFRRNVVGGGAQGAVLQGHFHSCVLSV